MRKNGTKESVELEVCEWYTNGEPIRDIMNAHGLSGYGQLYTILDKHGIARRVNQKTGVHPDKSEPTPPPVIAPERLWFFVDECAAIVGMSIADVEWLIHKHAVYTSVAKSVNGDFTLVYLPSLMEASQHASIDGKRAKQLLTEAWAHLDKVSRQQAINLADIKFVCSAIREFFVANGWELK